MKRIFLDTNVIIDFLEQREPIITRNAKDFPKDTICIVSPDEFLKQWSENTTD